MKAMAYYPGCALQSMSWDYRESIRHVMETLDVRLTEIPDWTCCGATAAHSLDEHMAVILPARNLARAANLGLDLAVACPMCFRRLSQTREVLLQERADVPWSISHGPVVLDLARTIAEPPFLDRIRRIARGALEGLRVVCYYGCQVVRPPRLTGYADYENPLHLDLIAAAAGAESLDWSFKATCCGAGIGIPKKEIGLSLVDTLLTAANACGAHAVVVCCPLCQTNLDLHQPEILRRKGMDFPRPLPVLYYTELLGMAFGIDSVWSGFKCHFVNPTPLLTAIRSRGGQRS